MRAALLDLPAASWSYRGALFHLSPRLGRYAFRGKEVHQAVALKPTVNSGGWMRDSSGLYRPFPANTLRRTDLGATVEAAQTSIQPKSRRLDDATKWTASNITVAAATGADGVAGSGSRITATADNGTILGTTFTDASKARRINLLVKRVTGSGVLQYTLNGSSTWTSFSAITDTANFVQLDAGASLANPRLGLRIATSGDAFDVDFLDGKSASFVSTPIESGDANVTRNADVVQIADALMAAWASLPAWTVFGRTYPNFAPGGSSAILGTTGGCQVINRSGSGQTVCGTSDGITPLVATLGGGKSFAADEVFVVLGADGSGRSICGCGGDVQTDAAVAGNYPLDAGYVGSRSGTLNFANGIIRDVAIFPGRMSSEAMQSFSAAGVLP